MQHTGLLVECLRLVHLEERIESNGRSTFLRSVGIEGIAQSKRKNKKFAKPIRAPDTLASLLEILNLVLYFLNAGVELRPVQQALEAFGGILGAHHCNHVLLAFPELRDGFFFLLFGFTLGEVGLDGLDLLLGW